MGAPPRTFAMPLMPSVEAVLVFDAGDAQSSGEYELFSLTPDEGERLSRDWSLWEELREGRTSTGRIPTTDVEFDEAAGFRIRTLGIERFAQHST